jgi:hypothetical protein
MKESGRIMPTRTNVGRFMVALIVSLTTAVAFAAVTWHEGPTLTQNAGADTVFNTVDDTFTATGDGSGFGNQPAVATITLSGTFTYTCQNKGGNTAPGQNQVTAITSGSADLGNADHNGRGTFDFTVGPITAAETVGGKEAGCPNGNWSGVNPQSSGSRTAVLTITQANKLIYTSPTITY